MIDLVTARPAAFEQVESLISQAPALEALAKIEHLYGVLPLVETFFERREELAEIVNRKRGSLGLFTPAPEPGWGRRAVEGEAASGGVLLSGEVRLPGRAAEGSLVLVKLAEEHRLAWLDHATPGVELRGTGPCWLRIEAAEIGLGLVSRPVTLAADGELVRCLTDYACVWALAAALLAQEGVRAMRRITRTSAYQGTAFNSSQWVALGITEVEIVADLAVSAARRIQQDGTGGLAVAVAAARALAAAVAKTEELRDVMGLDIDGPLSVGPSPDSEKSLIAFLGGALALENELARALGIQGSHE